MALSEPAVDQTRTKLIDAAAEGDPDRAALITDGRTITYGELAGAVERCVDRLSACGVSGKRVAVVDVGSLLSIATMLGAARIGAGLVTVAAPEAAQERTLYSLNEPEESNPYLWEYDLCSLTLGNFRYRRFSLVRDYAALLEQDPSHPVFDAVFSLAPREVEQLSSWLLAYDSVTVNRARSAVRRWGPRRST